MEGLESAEPWKLETRGLSGSEEQSGEPPQKKLRLDLATADIKTEGENKENIKSLAESTPVKGQLETSRAETEAALRKLGSEIMVTPRHDVPRTSEATRFTPRITPNGDRLNLFNHSQYFNMSMSPNFLNGSVTITPKEGGSTGFFPGLSIPSREQEKPWFNVVARAESPPVEVKQEEGEEDSGTDFHPGRRGQAELGYASQMGLLEQKLEIVKQMNQESVRMAIPKEHCHGWWMVPDEATVASIETCLLQKGTREQNLVINIRRGIEAILESSKKVAGEDINFLEEELEEQEGVEKVARVESVPEAPAQNPPEAWSESVALRCEKYLLEQVEALEDKVASASMQVPGWKIPDKPLVDSLNFRPSCLAKEAGGEGKQDPVAIARQRLLELEGAIERRYLKAPLGQSKDATLQHITTAQADKDESMEVDEEEEDEEETKENGVEKEAPTDISVEDATKKESNIEGEDKDVEKEEDKKEKKKALPSGVSRGLQTWRDAVKMSSNASQLAMAFYILETSIAWDKSIMKASCQFCHGGDNENALLLCDSCDKGYHTYCFKPAITNIPEGDW